MYITYPYEIRDVTRITALAISFDSLFLAIVCEEEEAESLSAHDRWRPRKLRSWRPRARTHVLRMYRIDSDRLASYRFRVTDAEFIAKAAIGEWANHCVFSPDGKYIVTSGRSISIFQTEPELQRVAEIRMKHEFPAGLAFSPDGTTVIATCFGYEKDTLWVYRVPDGHRIASYRFPDFNNLGVVRHIVGTTYAICTCNAPCIWNSASPDRLVPLQPAGKEIFLSDLAVSPDHRLIAAGGGTGVIRFWSIKTGRIMRQMSEKRQAIHSLAFTPNGRYLVSITEKRIALWRLQDRVVVAEHTRPNDFGKGVLSPDGRLVGVCRGGWHPYGWDKVSLCEIRPGKAI